MHVRVRVEAGHHSQHFVLGWGRGEGREGAGAAGAKAVGTAGGVCVSGQGGVCVRGGRGYGSRLRLGLLLPPAGATAAVPVLSPAPKLRLPKAYNTQLL